MDTSPSISQDETTSTSNETQIVPIHDVAAFGLSADLSDLKLPCIIDVLKYYFYLAERVRAKSKSFSYKTLTTHVTDKLIEIWSKLGLPIMQKRSVHTKLNKLLEKYRSETKQKTTSSTYPVFVQSTKELCNIAICKCNLKTAVCSCESIPKNLKEFMLDQNNDRTLTISDVQVEIEEQAPFSMTTIPSAVDRASDSTYQPDYMEMDTINPFNIGEEAGPS